MERSANTKQGLPTIGLTRKFSLFLIAGLVFWVRPAHKKMKIHKWGDGTAEYRQKPKGDWGYYGDTVEVIDDDLDIKEIAEATHRYHGLEGDLIVDGEPISGEALIVDGDSGECSTLTVVEDEAWLYPTVDNNTNALPGKLCYTDSLIPENDPLEQGPDWRI